MSYQVIARKWRPQTFSELVGQNHVTQTLLNALRHNRLHHALLFTGPRGTGKTSSARIVAKAIRCPNAVHFNPCGKCQECLDIAAGRALDVVEIDGASNNGVDSIRELIDTMGYMPSSGTRKVYVIDEVHMLSTSAFNALLKSLEEPPPHILFILATTEVHKIPQTILSRCQRFDFRRIPIQTITQQLQTIVEGEGLEAERDALWLIARQGEGSMRDSLSLLDQVISFSSGKLTAAQTLEILGLTDRALLLETFQALVSRDPQRALATCQKVLRGGFEPKIFMQDLLETIRNALMIKISDRSAVELPDSEILALQESSKDVSSEDLHLLFDMALKGAQDLTRISEPRVVFEMVLLRMSEAPRVQNLMAFLSGSRPATATPMPRPPASRTTAPSRPMQNAPEDRPEVDLTTSKSSAPVTLAEKWQDLVHKISAVNRIVGAKLENAFLKQLEQQKLSIGIPGHLKFLYDQVQDPQFQKKVQNYLTTFWGPGFTIEFEMAAAANNPGENRHSTPKVLAEQKLRQQQESARQQVESHPFVQSAQRVFKSEIKAIKETKT